MKGSNFGLSGAFLGFRTRPNWQGPNNVKHGLRASPNADKGIDCPKMHIMATWLIESVYWVFVDGIQEDLRPQVCAYMNYAFNTFLS